MHITINAILLLLFNCPVTSDSLQCYGLQYSIPPGPSPYRGVCPSSCPLHQWCHPDISSSDVLFYSAFFPASRSFPMSWLFALGNQSIGTSASTSVLSGDIQSWFPLRLTGFISLLYKGLSRVFSSSTVQKHQFSSILPSLCKVQLSEPYVTTGKTIALTIRTFVGKVMSLLFKIGSRFVISLLPKTSCLLISGLQSPSAVILEPNAIWKHLTNFMWQNKVFYCKHSFNE